MKLIIFFCIAVLAFAKEKRDIIDEIHLGEALENDSVLIAYSKCLVNKGPCTPEIQKLKDKLPEFLETCCEKFSENQKQTGRQLVNEVMTKHPEIWKELVAFYDPQGKYKKAFEEFIKQ